MTQQIQWTKTVCQLDSNGLFLHQTTAELDVYTKDGGYIIPGGCIDTAPPEAREGHAAKWTGDKWEYLPDLRGRTAYRTDNGQAVIIDTVGALSDGLTLTAPPSRRHTWSGKQWTLSKAAQAEQLAEAKAAKLVEINRAAQAFISRAAGLDKVPAFEVETWAIQKQEAEAWAVDNRAETPVLDAIAAARGIDGDTLKAAALKKAQAYTALCANIAGQRQHLADLLDAAKNLDAVAAIEAAYTA